MKEQITAADLDAVGLGDEERVLLRTSNSEGVLRSPWKAREWVGLAPDGAERLIEAGVRTAGIDYLSIEAVAYTTHWETHQLLCAADVLILEVVDLLHTPAGVYDMLSLPLPLQGAEAAPSRTVLLPRDDT